MRNWTEEQLCALNDLQVIMLALLAIAEGEGIEEDDLLRELRRRAYRSADP